jgi:hypothetical protein
MLVEAEQVGKVLLVVVRRVLLVAAAAGLVQLAQIT